MTNQKTPLPRFSDTRPDFLSPSPDILWVQDLYTHDGLITLVCSCIDLVLERSLNVLHGRSRIRRIIESALGFHRNLDKEYSLAIRVSGAAPILWTLLKMPEY